jgi:hypothetical protein
MQVMQDEDSTKVFKPKGFSTAEGADAHQEVEVVDVVSAEARHSTWGGASLIFPQHRDEDFHLLHHREAGFPQDLVVNMVAQQDHQHSYHLHLLPKAG